MSSCFQALAVARGHGRPGRDVRRKTGGTPVPPDFADAQKLEDVVVTWGFSSAQRGLLSNLAALARVVP
jgi:hypothetical protein